MTIQTAHAQLANVVRFEVVSSTKYHVVVLYMIIELHFKESTPTDLFASLN